MINDLRIGFKVLKYGLNAKKSIIPMAILVIIGALMDLLLPVAGFSSLYLGMGGMVLIQQIHSVSVSTMVQTSSYKKRLQTVMPTLVGGVYLLIANTLCLIFQWVSHQRALNNTRPDLIITYAPGEFETGMLFTALVLIFITIYAVLSTKYFWIGTVIFLGGFVGFMKFAQQGEMSYIMMPEWLAILLSYGIILLGCLVIYAISCITYKREYSKLTFETQLKRAS